MPEATSAALPELDGICKSFGRVVVADGLSLRVGAGDMVGIVGPNGAGKTSLFSLISGDLAPDAGEIRLAGVAVIRQNPAARCRLGIGRTYQVPRPFGAMTVFEKGRRLFPSRTVEENLQVGASCGRKGPWSIPRVCELFGWMPGRRRQLARGLWGLISERSGLRLFPVGYWLRPGKDREG